MCVDSEKFGENVLRGSGRGAPILGGEGDIVQKRSAEEVVIKNQESAEISRPKSTIRTIQDYTSIPRLYNAKRAPVIGAEFWRCWDNGAK